MTPTPIADIVAGLRAKMEGVPAGPWTRASYGVDLCPPDKCGPAYLEVRADGCADICRAVGTYITTCDPDTIRAVLDEHDALRAQLAAATKERDDISERYTQFAKMSVKIAKDADVEIAILRAKTLELLAERDAALRDLTEATKTLECADRIFQFDLAEMISWADGCSYNQAVKDAADAVRAALSRIRKAGGA